LFFGWWRHGRHVFISAITAAMSRSNSTPIHPQAAEQCAHLSPPAITSYTGSSHFGQNGCHCPPVCLPLLKRMPL
jgi:hypothetical protein